MLSVLINFFLSFFCSFSNLLEVSGEPVQVLVVREEGVGLGAAEVVVPDAEQGEYDRGVPLQWRRGEVVVHVMSSRQQLLEVVEP